jgi:hypothetical protein
VKLAFDLAGYEKPACSRIDSREPECVDCAAILVMLLEQARRELLDNSVEEILAKLHFCAGFEPACSESKTRESK